MDSAFTNVEKNLGEKIDTNIERVINEIHLTFNKDLQLTELRKQINEF